MTSVWATYTKPLAASLFVLLLAPTCPSSAPTSGSPRGIAKLPRGEAHMVTRLGRQLAAGPNQLLQHLISWMKTFNSEGL